MKIENVSKLLNWIMITIFSVLIAFGPLYYI